MWVGIVVIICYTLMFATSAYRQQIPGFPLTLYAIASLICTTGCQNTNVLQGMAVFLRVFSVIPTMADGYCVASIKNSVVLVRERPPLVGEVIANFCR
jgi:xanthine/uracil permease